LWKSQYISVPRWGIKGKVNKIFLFRKCHNSTVCQDKTYFKNIKKERPKREESERK
jgi:hypothetical protein